MINGAGRGRPQRDGGVRAVSADRVPRAPETGSGRGGPGSGGGGTGSDRGGPGSGGGGTGSDRGGPGSGAGESGFVGGFEGLLFGLLLFVVGTLLVSTAWAAVDTKFAVDAAARQAVRTYVEAASAGAAGPQSQAAAADTLAGYGRASSGATIRLVAGTFARCARVTIEVSEPAPILVLPWIGRVGAGAKVSARASELVDPFRTGLPGTSTCA